MSTSASKRHGFSLTGKKRLLWGGLLALLPACVLYATWTDTASDNTSAVFAANPGETCNPLEEWVGRRLDKVVMTDNELITGVVITEVCQDFVRLESTGGGRIYLVSTDSIVLLEGRPE